MLLLNCSSFLCDCQCIWLQGWEQIIICLYSAFVSLVGRLINICKQSNLYHIISDYIISYGHSAMMPPQAMLQPNLDIFWSCMGKCFKRQAGVWFISVTPHLLCGLFQFYYNDISLNSIAHDLVAFVNLHCVIMYDLGYNMLGFITWQKERNET